MKSFLAAALVTTILSFPSLAAEKAPDLTAELINSATFDGWVAGLNGKPIADMMPKDEEAVKAETEDKDRQKYPDPFLIRMQVLLDRHHASPGVIDGYLGENVVKAIRTFEEMRGFPIDGMPDAEVWNALTDDTAPAVIEYSMTKKDARGPYVKGIPTDYAKKAEMKELSYTSAREMLSERFHMDEDLAQTLNEKSKFKKAGTKLLVTDPGASPTEKVVRIVVDKSEGELKAFAADGRMVVAYPATIGSEDTPSPTGEIQVEAVHPDPDYTYNPKINFKQGKNNKILDIPRGPNGPVGNMWIKLAKPTYGIHGTPEPSKIDKSQSHGCVRLTNWDATELASLVTADETMVIFQD